MYKNNKERNKMSYYLCKKSMKHKIYNFPICSISRNYFNFNKVAMIKYELKPGMYANIWYDHENLLVDIEFLRPQEQGENSYKIQSTFRLRNTALTCHDKFTLKIEDIMGYYKLYKVKDSCRITIDLKNKLR